MVIVPTDLNQWRWKDRIAERRKYVFCYHNNNALKKAPFEVATAYPYDPKLVFSFSNTSSESMDTAFCNPEKL